MLKLTTIIRIKCYDPDGYLGYGPDDAMEYIASNLKLTIDNLTVIPEH